jgi:hypothetical protein
MEKLVYLLWKRDADAISDFRARLLEDAAPKLVADGALALVANVADLLEKLPEKSPLVVGEGRAISASVSVWVESQDHRAALEPTIDVPRVACTAISSRSRCRCAAPTGTGPTENAAPA